MKQIIFVISLFLFLASSPLIAAKVDINKADAQTIEENLVGIGEVKARAIVNYRNKHGNFKSLDDLMQVPGLGEATIEKNRKNLSLKEGLSNSKKTETSNKKSTASKTTTAKNTKAKTEKNTNIQDKAKK